VYHILKKRIKNTFLLLTLVFSSPVWAVVSYQNVIDWVSDELGSAITIESGQYGQSDLDRVRNLIPPGYFDEFDFPELSMEIMPTNRYQAHELYLNATKKFSGQAFLSKTGELENYTAGMPFSREQILAESSQSSGLMVAYNQIHRWQNFGYKVDNLTFNVEPSPNGKKGNLVESVMLGGGHVDRDFTMFYHRVYLSKLASKPKNSYALDVDGSDELFFKEYVGFSAPFDMAGMKFVIERPLKQSRGDQVNSYLPTERRVRRLSARERADSWVGTNWTLDDFEGFSGLVVDNDWSYVGQKNILHVASSKNITPLLHGPDSLIPLDRWQVRPAFVVEAIPKWKDHPYGKRLMFVDQETYTIMLTMVFSQDDTLWKLFTTQYQYSDNIVNPSPALSTPRWRSSVAINIRDRNGSVGAATGPSEYVEIEPSKVRRLFDVSNLTSGR
jgi:hypothetical protein